MDGEGAKRDASEGTYTPDHVDSRNMPKTMPTAPLKMRHDMVGSVTGLSYVEAS